jgi:hypothetical protein
VARLSAGEDDINLRCWDQKRRFGIDFLYPIDRYQQAFTAALIPNASGEMVPNPIFSDLDPTDGITKIRGPEGVLVSGVVGVPWQDIARDQTDAGKGFKSAAELAAPITQGGPTVWDVILGDLANNVKPLDPLMIETFEKRSGTNPITNDPIATSAMPLANAINGHDWTIAANDLQYACIFPLPSAQQRDCTDASASACDCVVSTSDSPLCQANPNDNDLPTLQVRAKAYPGLRPLQLFKSLDDQAIFGSVCPAQVTNDQMPDFGYRPLVRSIVEWISRRGC